MTGLQEFSVWVAAFILSFVWIGIAARFKYAPDDFIGPAVVTGGPFVLLLLAAFVRGVWLMIDAWL